MVFGVAWTLSGIILALRRAHTDGCGGQGGSLGAFRRRYLLWNAQLGILCKGCARIVTLSLIAELEFTGLKGHR